MLDDGRRQHRGAHAQHSHRDRARDEQGRVRAGYRARRRVDGLRAGRDGAARPRARTGRSQMTELLRVEEAAKSYDGRALLAVSELHLAQGDLIVLTGDNGSGKTTFLKMLAGLDHGDRLALRYNGFAATHVHYPREMRREIVYVHQHPYLFHTTI